MTSTPSRCNLRMEWTCTQNVCLGTQVPSAGPPLVTVKANPIRGALRHIPATAAAPPLLLLLSPLLPLPSPYKAPACDRACSKWGPASSPHFRNGGHCHAQTLAQACAWACLDVSHCGFSHLRECMTRLSYRCHRVLVEHSGPGPSWAHVVNR